MLRPIDMRARLALATAALAAALALTADRADAAYSPVIQDRTLVVIGDAASDKLALRVPASAPTMLELDVGENGSAEFRIPRARFDRIRVLAGAGSDRVRVDDSGVRGPVAVPTSVDGEAGADLLLGGRGAEQLTGGDGADVVDGNGGSDVVALGPGNDRFVWDAADGSGAVEGGDGFDRLTFNGSDAQEQLRLAASGARVRLTREAAAIGLDTEGVEQLDLAALGGDDTLTIGDLEGTSVQGVNVDLASAPGAAAPDTGSDRLVLDATSADDAVHTVSTGTGQASVLGLPAFVSVVHADPAGDELTINGLAGDDLIDAAGGSAMPLALVQDGGPGNDTLGGGGGADVQSGGDGDDFVDGGRGDDSVRLGAGHDRFSLRAGDGSDTLEAQAGTDRVVLSGSSANERFDVSAGERRLRLLYDGAVILGAGDVEALDVISMGGADRVTVGDLSGTDLTDVSAHLFDFGVPGGAEDLVRVDATNGNDAIKVAGSATVTGLAARIAITGATAANDRLEVNGLAGDDSVDSSSLPAAAIQLSANLGSGNDVLTAGAGRDVASGGDGADVLFAGRGDNVVQGGAGDDVLRGEDGDDLLDGGADDDVLIGGAGDDVLLNGEAEFDE